MTSLAAVDIAKDTGSDDPTSSLGMDGLVVRSVVA